MISVARVAAVLPPLRAGRAQPEHRPQPLRHRLRERHLTLAVLALRWRERPSVVAAPNVHPLLAEVDIAPGQSDEFADSKAGLHEKLRDETVGFRDRREEALHL